jgi:hypothetical protein
MRADARWPASAHSADGCGLALEGARHAKSRLACVPVIHPLGEEPPRSLHAVDDIVGKPRFPAN